MRAGRRILLLLASAILAQASCAEIPTAPLHMLTLRGSVLDPEGGPILGAELAFRRIPRGGGTALAARTGSDGTYSLQVTAGRYSVDISAPYGTGVPNVRVDEVNIVGASPRYDYRYTGHKVLGTVTGPSGAPVTNATVSFHGDAYNVSVQTRFDGNAFLAFLPPGSYTVVVSPPSIVEGIPARVFRSYVLNSDTTLAFSLSGRRVHGHAVGPDGLPMAGVTIYLEGTEAVSGCNSSPDGSYEVFIPDGFYRRSAYPGLGDRNVMDRDFGYVMVSGDLSIDFDFSGIWWSGTVLDAPGGVAVPWARVTVYCLTEPGYADVTCDANGLFRISVIQGTWHRVRVYAPNHDAAVMDPLFAGADSTLELVAGPLASPSTAPTVRADAEPARPALRFLTPLPRAGRAAAE